MMIRKFSVSVLVALIGAVFSTSAQASFLGIATGTEVFVRNAADLSAHANINIGLPITAIAGVGNKVVVSFDAGATDDLQLYNNDLTFIDELAGFDPREQLVGLGDGSIATGGGGFIHRLDGSDLSVLGGVNFGVPFTGLDAVGADKFVVAFDVGATDDLQLYNNDLTFIDELAGFDPREGLAGLGDGNIATAGGGFLHLLDGSDLSVLNSVFLGAATIPFTGLTGVGADKLAFSFTSGTDELQLWSSDLTTQIATLSGFDPIVELIGLSDGNIALATSTGEVFVRSGTDLSHVAVLSGFTPGSIVEMADIIPEPTSLFLMGIAGVMIVLRRRVT